MNKMANVEVLMSTYNGEKYLRQQMDSILTQKGNFNLKISVRDDGSVDSTPDILREYSNRYGINVTYGKNIGLNASMMELVKASEETFDVFSFCDQDDVWKDFKISEAVNAISRFTEQTPVLWSCMEELTDENLSPYSLMPSSKYLGDFYNAVVQNSTAGHTQVFNRELRDIYKSYPPEKMYVYDWVLYILASEFGEVCFCDKICGWYRQHGDNTLGYSTKLIAKSLMRLKRLLNGDLERTVVQLCHIYDAYNDKLLESHKTELRRFLENRQNIFKRIHYALTTKFKRNTVFESLQFRILYVAGAFNLRQMYK